MPSVTYKDAASAVATSVTIPTHVSGDMIVVWAYRRANATPPTVPAAGGTVPTWNTITANTGTSNTGSMVMAYAVATSATTTTGTFTNCTRITVAVLSGQNTANPVGGNDEVVTGISSANTNHTFPAITLSDTTGSSAILAICCLDEALTVTQANGYTSRLSSATLPGFRLATKNDTTSDGSFVFTTSSGTYSRGAVLEIVPANTTNFFHFI